MKKILYTGFKGKNNASYILATYLSKNPYLLTNSFDGLRRDIEHIDDDYDYVLMFGIDTKLKASVRIERVAVQTGITLLSELELDSISKHLEKVGVANYISDIPTHYLCNEAYWFALQKFDKKVVFIHIPSVNNIDEEFLYKMKRGLSINE